MSDARADIVVDVQDVHRELWVGGEIIRALRGINLQVRRGEYVSIMAPSGSGKTPLFNMIGGLDKATAEERRKRLSGITPQSRSIKTDAT